MIQFFLILLAALFGSVVVQHFIPPLEFLEGARVIIMPLVLFYGALALPVGGMLFLAFFAGVLWDLSITQVLDNGAPTVEIALGYSVILYAALGAIMSGFRPLFLKGRWEIHCLLSGVCTILIVIAEFGMLSLRRAAVFEAPFVFDNSLRWRVLGPGLVAAVLAPVVFFFLSALASWVGYNPRAVPKKTEEEEA